MRALAIVVCTSLVLPALFTAAYIVRPGEPVLSSRPAPTEAAAKVRDRAVPTWAAARTWADPPARQQDPTDALVAEAEVGTPAGEPPATGTLPQASDVALTLQPLRARRVVQRSARLAPQAARVGRQYRHATAHLTRQKRMYEPGSTALENKPQNEPPAVRAMPEPIQFSLASR